MISRKITIFYSILRINFYSADWYKDRLTDAELDALENPPTPPPSKAKVKGPSRRKPAKVVVEPEDD